MGEWVFVFELNGSGSESGCCHINDIVTVSNKEFLDIQATIVRRFALKHDIITYSQYKTSLEALEIIWSDIVM